MRFGRFGRFVKFREFKKFNTLNLFKRLLTPVSHIGAGFLTGVSKRNTVSNQKI
jgi:hypothetical protein